MQYTLKPLGNRVLIEREDTKKATSSGILLPEQAQEKPREGVIVAVGWEGTRDHQVKVGDRIMMPKYGGIEVEGMGGIHKHTLLDEDDILGILVPFVHDGLPPDPGDRCRKVEIDNTSIEEPDIPHPDDFDEPLPKQQCDANSGEPCESCT